MKAKSLLKEINWPIILFHILGTIFIVIGAKLFSKLYDIELVEYFNNFSLKEVFNHNEKSEIAITSKRVSLFLNIIYFGSLFGLLCSFLISFKICLRKKIKALNSLIVLALGLFIFLLGFFDSYFIRTISLGLGTIFISSGLKFLIIIKGVIFTSLGLLAFLLSNRFIKSNKMRSNS